MQGSSLCQVLYYRLARTYIHFFWKLPGRHGREWREARAAASCAPWWSGGGRRRVVAELFGAQISNFFLEPLELRSKRFLLVFCAWFALLFCSFRLFVFFFFFAAGLHWPVAQREAVLGRRFSSLTLMRSFWRWKHLIRTSQQRIHKSAARRSSTAGLFCTLTSQHIFVLFVLFFFVFCCWPPPPHFVFHHAG